MKRSKRIGILLCVLLAACAVTFALMGVEERKEQIKTSGEIIMEVASDSVQSLSWTYGENSFSFRRNNGSWLYEDDEDFPVDEEKIAALLDQFESFGVSFIIEDVEDLSVYGLDDPVCTIQFETEDQSTTMELGNFSEMDEERYVSIGDGNVYLAKVDPLDQFDAVLSDLIDHDESLSYDTVSQISFQGTDSYAIQYEENSTASYCADDVYFTQQDGTSLPLDTDRVESYLETLTTLSLTDYVTYHATEEELVSYGLDVPELTVTVDYTSTDDSGTDVSDSFVLSFSRNPEELAAAEEAEEKGETAEDITGYVRIGDSQIVYRVSAYTVESLMAYTYDDLRHREVLTADLADIDQLDITLDGADYTLTADESSEADARTWMYDGEQIDADELESALTELRASSTKSFTVDGTAGKEEICLTVYLNNENHPQVTIELYRYDGSQCLSKVDGETFALVPRADVVDLIEAVNAIILEQ